MDEPEGKKMSAVGMRLWLHMQEKGPYNKRAFARMLTRTGIYPTSHQNISNWLSREHPPPEFVNAAVAALRLTREEEIELHDVYFRGQRVPSSRELDAAMEVEAEVAAEEQATHNAPKDQKT